MNHPFRGIMNEYDTGYTGQDSIDISIMQLIKCLDNSLVSIKDENNNEYRFDQIYSSTYTSLSGSGDGTREFGLPIDGIFAINAKYSY
jgi:hypothetical protein